MQNKSYEYISVFIIIFVILISFISEYFIDFSKTFLIINILITLFIPTYFIIRIIIEKLNLNKIEKSFENTEINLDYYRELIKNYSPSILSLIYDHKFEYKKDLIVNLLYLEKEKYIEVNKKVCRNDKNYEQLPLDLKLIMDNIDFLLKKEVTPEEFLTHKTLNSVNLKATLNNLVLNEAIKMDLIQRKPKTISLSGIILIILLSIIAFICFINQEFLIALYSIFNIIALALIKALTFSRHELYRTSKGNELYKKLLGLKKYIHDFSNIENGDLKDIKLWDDYTIYAIILNKENKLIKDIYNLYETLYKNANKNT